MTGPMRHHSRQPRSRLHTAFTTILLLESVALLVSLPAAAVLGAALLLLTRPRIRRWFDSRFGEAHFSAESDARMSRPRLWIANLLIGVLVLGSLSAIWRGKEYWPFSNYPMYSGIERPVAAWMRIYGRERGPPGCHPSIGTFRRSAPGMGAAPPTVR